jgi:hypothetical protein
MGNGGDSPGLLPHLPVPPTSSLLEHDSARPFHVPPRSIWHVTRASGRWS